VLALCQAAGADRYLSGPAARDYLDEAAFADGGVELVYMDYAGYPAYDQPHPPYDPAVSALDLLFCTGDRAAEFMKFPAWRAAHPWPNAPAQAG
jgi:hypothetical protein